MNKLSASYTKSSMMTKSEWRNRVAIFPGLALKHLLFEGVDKLDGAEEPAPSAMTFDTLHANNSGGLVEPALRLFR